VDYYDLAVQAQETMEVKALAEESAAGAVQLSKSAGKAAQELPPGAIEQAASNPLIGEVEDASPPSQGDSPQQLLDEALSPNAKTSFYHWEEAEVSSLSGHGDQVLRVFCGVWNLHGKKAPANLNQWVPTSPRHHIYVIGTCECERTIEKSLIWSNKARWERQMGSHLGEDFRMTSWSSPTDRCGSSAGSRRPARLPRGLPISLATKVAHRLPSE